jgi:membrane-bound lytic murein transglycosylase B
MYIQRALKTAGYNPGQNDGVIGHETSQAIVSYQKAKGLAQGSLTIETLKSLRARVRQSL